MRRWSSGILAGLLILIPALAAFGSTQTRYIKDRFDSVSYSGSNGDLPWLGPWTENDALGGGAGAGQVHVGAEDCAVAENCAHFEGQGQTSLGRFADLSNHVYADTSFYVSNVVAAEGVLDVYVTGNGGANWQWLHGFDLNEELTWHDALFIPEEFYTEGFGLKLVVTGSETTELTIDDVEIKGTVEEAGSTTTTTVPSTTTTKKATTTTEATTTTSQPTSTTSTTTRPTSTTTTAPSTTTTVSQEVVPLIGPTVPPNSGIRDTERGLLARYDSRSFSGGALGIGDIEVLGVEVTADFSIAAEAFGAARIWVAVLALVMAAAIVSGMDWRRTRKLSD